MTTDTIDPIYLYIDDAGVRWHAGYLKATLRPLAQAGNPFAVICLRDNQAHGQALAEAFIAGRDMQEVYACIRLARRLGRLPEGSYTDGCHFDAFRDRDDLDVDSLRSHAWELRDKLAELSHPAAA